MNTQHLWEVDHAYYCNLGNYYSNECVFEFRSWQDFMEEMGDADLDYNLLFRWDWKEADEEGEPNFNGDVNYRNGKLELFFMQQRKGRFVANTVEVCRADEEAIRKYLEPRLAYLMALWSPVAALQQSQQAGKEGA